MKINIIGSGNFASALAFNLANDGKKIQIWSRSKKQKKDLFRDVFLKDTKEKVLKNIMVTTDLKKSLSNTEISLLCIPAQTTKRFFQKNYKIIPKIPMIICCKGIDNETHSLQSEILKKYCPSNLCLILSGPSFAKEIINQKPTAVTLACEENKEGKRIQNILSNKNLRIYFSNDIIGVQIGGALKNVIALACGITAGKELGESAKISLMTRGFFEIKKIGVKMGGKPETFSGLSCLGDLCLTCNSNLSRNFQKGFSIGRKTFYNESTVEGLKTSEAASILARKLDVETPIINAVCQIIKNEKSVSKVISNLLNRPLIDEN